jgi:REP element-mobilizing transposase RayT
MNATPHYNPAIHHRRSIRLPEYDYSREGAYFITLCVHNREWLFGEIVDGEMRLNEYGEIMRDVWLETSTIRPNVELSEWVVMPNHFHAIVIITRRGVLQYAPTDIPTSIHPKLQSPSQTIGAIVRGFKSAVTKRINEIRATPGMPVWQRNYWEHVIRNEKSFHDIAAYIINNPSKWEMDTLYCNWKGDLAAAPTLL